MERSRVTHQVRDGEEGFTLAGVIVILTIISVIVAYTVPDQWSLIMKRERDRQTIFLMKQYARAILAWESKHRTLPVSLEQLREARDPRLIRGQEEWLNPLTGSANDWIMVPPRAITAGQGVPGLPGGPAGNPATAGIRPEEREAASRIGVGLPDGGTQHNAPPQQGGGPSRLNPEASPADYVGPFVAVRPNATGKSYIAFNGAEDYSEWVYTIQDLKNEIAMRQMALAAR